MADEGYAYVPDACARGEPCRVHVAFHGCGQSAEQIGSAFYEHAGYNRWADLNRLIVLYPQTRPSQPTPLAPLLPLNPKACWDWWGYNDGLKNRGRFATQAGLQIAAVRRMLDRLAGRRAGATPSQAVVGEFGAPSGLVVGDFTHRQVALRWDAVAGAVGYNVYRSTLAGGPYGRNQRLNARLVESPLFVDTGPRPRTEYFYVVRAVNRSNRESLDSIEVGMLTASRPPPCDLFFPFEKARRSLERTSQPRPCVREQVFLKVDPWRGDPRARPQGPGSARAGRPLVDGDALRERSMRGIQGGNPHRQGGSKRLLFVRQRVAACPDRYNTRPSR
jgi:poly(3-hydroxybutyrate) depolymerase